MRRQLGGEGRGRRRLHHDAVRDAASQSGAKRGEGAREGQERRRIAAREMECAMAEEIEREWEKRGGRGGEVITERNKERKNNIAES